MKRMLIATYMTCVAIAAQAAIQQQPVIDVNRLGDYSVIVPASTVKKVPAKHFIDLPNYVTPEDIFPFRKQFQPVRT